MYSEGWVAAGHQNFNIRHFAMFLPLRSLFQLTEFFLLLITLKSELPYLVLPCVLSSPPVLKYIRVFLYPCLSLCNICINGEQTILSNVVLSNGTFNKLFMCFCDFLQLMNAMTTWCFLCCFVLSSCTFIKFFWFSLQFFGPVPKAKWTN